LTGGSGGSAGVEESDCWEAIRGGPPGNERGLTCRIIRRPPGGINYSGDYIGHGSGGPRKRDWECDPSLRLRDLCSSVNQESQTRESEKILRKPGSENPTHQPQLPKTDVHNTVERNQGYEYCRNKFRFCRDRLTWGYRYRRWSQNRVCQCFRQDQWRWPIAFRGRRSW
jgi:hypothetical protein